MATISKTDKLSEVRKDADRLNAKAHTADELMEGITALLNEQMLKYNWVGFYMLEPGANPPVLVLGHYRGAMTPHTRIPLNQGICGAAASLGKTVVVDDVKQDPRYLACSLETKSEIVVPVFANGAVAGELDIDSHFPAAFGAEDRAMIEYIALLVGKRLEKEQSPLRILARRQVMKRVVAALIVKDDLILACQRTRHQPMPLKWEFPGGKIEEGEQPRDAMRRELEEELGIVADVGVEVARLVHEYPGGGSVELRFFEVRHYQGEVENRIFREIRWVTRKDLLGLDFLEADLTLVTDLAAGKII